MKKNSTIYLKIIIIFAVAAGFLGFSKNASAATSATFISQVKDAGQASDFTTITWTDYVPANTSVAVSVRANDSFSPPIGCIF